MPLLLLLPSQQCQSGKKRIRQQRKHWLVSFEAKLLLHSVLFYQPIFYSQHGSFRLGTVESMQEPAKEHVDSISFKQATSGQQMQTIHHNPDFLRTHSATWYRNVKPLRGLFQQEMLAVVVLRNLHKSIAPSSSQVTVTSASQVTTILRYNKFDYYYYYYYRI